MSYYFTLPRVLLPTYSYLILPFRRTSFSVRGLNNKIPVCSKDSWWFSGLNVVDGGPITKVETGAPTRGVVRRKSVKQTVSVEGHRYCTSETPKHTSFGPKLRVEVANTRYWNPFSEGRHV